MRTLLQIFTIILMVRRNWTVPSRPNIVVMVADDLGIGDLGCYGNSTINTPNIDRLANEGVKLTHHLAAASMCTPSRAALLTARYPARYGLVGEEGTAPVVVHVAGRAGLPKSEITIGRALSAANYTTAAVGKWHQGQMCGTLGRGCHGPRYHGFRHFYGLPFTLSVELEGPHTFWVFPLEDVFYQRLASVWVLSFVTVLVFASYLGWSRWSTMGLLLLMMTVMTFVWFIRTHYRLHTERWWQVSKWMDFHMNGIVMRDEAVEEQPLVLEGLSQRLVNYSVRFIDEHARDDNPFFLYHSFAHVHTPMFTVPRFAGQSKHGRYGDNIEEMDDGVGTILNALSRNGLDQNTIVYFLSDHGGHLEAIDREGLRVGGHNGLFKGGKGQGGSEGGIRVAGIYRWRGHLPAGVTIDTPTSLLDMMPTLLELANLPPLPRLLPHLPQRDLDGTSIANLLIHGEPIPSRILLHHCRQAIHALRLVQDGHVYKMHIARPPWFPGSTQCGWGENALCPCFGDLVQNLTLQPLLFDLSKDPYEDQPIPSDTPEYNEVVSSLQKYLAEWRVRVPYPPSQFRNRADTVLALWRQPFRMPW